MNTKREIIYPSPEEDMEITAAALSDIDALPMTDEDVEQYVHKTKPVTQWDRSPNIHIEPELLEALEKTGEHWTWRVNGFLRDYAGEHGMFMALLRRNPDYQEQRSNPVSDEKRELRREAGGGEGKARALNFRVHLAVEDAFMTSGTGWAQRINAALREYAIEHSLLDRK